MICWHSQCADKKPHARYKQWKPFQQPIQHSCWFTYAHCTKREMVVMKVKYRFAWWNVHNTKGAHHILLLPSYKDHYYLISDFTQSDVVMIATLNNEIMFGIHFAWGCAVRSHNGKRIGQPNRAPTQKVLIRFLKGEILSASAIRIGCCIVSFWTNNGY